MICPQCHSENRAGAKFCDECGCKLPAADPVPAPSTLDVEKTEVLKPVVLDRAKLPEIDIPGVNVAEDGTRFDDEFSEDDILADEAAEAEAETATNFATDPESNDEVGECATPDALDDSLDGTRYTVDYTGFDVLVSDEVPEPTASFDPVPQKPQPVEQQEAAADETDETAQAEHAAEGEGCVPGKDTSEASESDFEEDAPEGEERVSEEGESAADESDSEENASEEESLDGQSTDDRADDPAAEGERADDEEEASVGEAPADEASFANDEPQDENADGEYVGEGTDDEGAGEACNPAAASSEQDGEQAPAAEAPHDAESEPSAESAPDATPQPERASDEPEEPSELESESTSQLSAEKTRALDNLPDPFDDVPDEDAQRAMDYGASTERLVAPDYVKPPRQTGRAGDTMEIPRVGDEPEQKRDFRAPREKGSNKAAKTAAAVLITLAVAGGVVAGVTYYLELWGGRTVPDVVGMTQTDAQYLLESKGFSVRSTTVQSDETEGLVLLMDPGAHARQNPGTEVVIHVSEARTVPYVVGKSREEAQAAFDEDGYTNVSFVEELSDEPAGTVLAVSPEVGAKAHAGDAVAVTVALPRAVPRVAGMTWDQAKAALEELGLAPQSASVYDDSVTEGTLTGTDPAPGTVCTEGETVTVYIAKSRGTELVAAAKSYLGSVGSITVDGTQFNIQAVDAVEYAGDDTTTFTVTGQGVATASVLGETVTVAGQVRQVTGTITWDDANQPTALSAK